MKRYIFCVKYFDPETQQPKERTVQINAFNHLAAWNMVVGGMDNFLSGNINYLDEIGLVTIEEC